MTTHAEIIAYLVAAYPGAEFPLPSQRLYLLELKHIPADELMEAARYHVHTSPYPKVPTMGELENSLTLVRRKKSGVPDPFVAWGEAVKVLTLGLRAWRTVRCDEDNSFMLEAQRAVDERRHKDYNDILEKSREHSKTCQICFNGYVDREFSHPLIKQALEAIGVKGLSDDESEGVIRAHFVKAYEQLIKRLSDDSLPVFGNGYNQFERLGTSSNGMKQIGQLLHPSTGEVLETYE